MNNEVIVASIFGSLLLFFSCEQYKVKDPDQCLGVWEMLEDASNGKSIVLKRNGEAEFNDLSIEDIGGDEGGRVPATGTWKLVSDGVVLEIWFTRNGGDYGQGGSLVEKKGGLEIWFAVGDPDSFEWKRFRLVKNK